jgi:hypothetical protein
VEARPLRGALSYGVAALSAGLVTETTRSSPASLVTVAISHGPATLTLFCGLEASQ